MDNNQPATKQDLESIKDELNRLIGHIHGVGGQLHTQIQESENRIVSRFAPVEARLERHGGMLRGGSVQIVRLVEWSEKIDGIIAQQQAEISELKRRLLDKDQQP